MESKNNTNGHPEDTKPVIPPISPQDKEEHSPARGPTAEQKLDDNEKPPNRWMIRFTGVIAFAAVVQGVIAYYQWTAMSDQLAIMDNQLREIREGGKDTHELAVSAKTQADSTKAVADSTLAQVEATNKLAKEAKRSADIAGMSLTASKKLSEEDRRAWVSVESVREIKPQIGKPLLFSVSFKNTGKTPGKRFSVIVSREITDKDREPTLEDRDIPRRSYGIIPPNGGYVANLYVIDNVTKEINDLLNSGKIIVYFYGKVTYDDIFNKPHWTTFCSRFIPGEGRFANYEKHNDIDKD